MIRFNVVCQTTLVETRLNLQWSLTDEQQKATLRLLDHLRVRQMMESQPRIIVYWMPKPKVPRCISTALCRVVHNHSFVYEFVVLESVCRQILSSDAFFSSLEIEAFKIRQLMQPLNIQLQLKIFWKCSSYYYWSICKKHALPFAQFISSTKLFC